jgi:predicted metal-dependent peptidase
MNTLHTVSRRLLAARKALVLDHAFFGNLALRLDIFQETKGRTRTMATDGRAIYYDPSYVKGRSDAELVGLWAHEVMHPALQHHTRRGDRDPEVWNESCDFAIDPVLVAAGLTLPEGGHICPEYAGMTAEQIYEIRIQNRNRHGSEEDRESGQPDDSSGEDDDKRAGDDDDQSGGQPGSPQLADRPGAVWDAPDPAGQEAEWKVALVQASRAAQMMGQLPAGIPQLVEEVLKPRIDWKAILRRFVQQCAPSDYSWRMPNRRYVRSGLFLPELRSVAMGPVVMVVDSSGSTWNVLPVFKAELQSIVEECQPEATIVVMADAEVQRIDRFERGEPIEFNVKGLGGTDFRPAFACVEREELNPACLIYLTDGYGVYPDNPPDFPTLWAISTPGQLAPWGDTVYIDPTVP